MNKATDTTRELPNLPKQRGGRREGAGRKKEAHETKSLRIDTRLFGILIALKNRLKDGTINDEELKKIEELAAN
jgi:hypothetical protein